MSLRLRAMGQLKYKDGFAVRVHPAELSTPLKWRTPKVVFVNSMSDLFHKDVPTSFIKQVFEVMNQTPQHTYQVLTKRPERALELGSELTWSNNIWLSTSVEDLRVAGRIRTLRQSRAKIKFLSLEPLIGPLPKMNLNKIDWAIVGGESGPGARPMRLSWVKDILQQCRKSNTPFFFKQWGTSKFNPCPEDPTLDKSHPDHTKGGCQINGKMYRDFPKGFKLNED